MPSHILHLSGPAGSGKTTLARVLTSAVPANRFYHIRFDLHRGDAPPKLRLVHESHGRISTLHCYVKPETVFETFSEALSSVAGDGEQAVVIAETDCHPCFRHAFPYDVKVFIMPPPRDLADIFRSGEETAGAIDRAMHDTAEFAAELFGLERVGPQDSAWLPALDKLDCKADQSVDDFVNSPVGTEIASRLQLRPSYQGVFDSDVVFLNTFGRVMIHPAGDCIERIESLLEPLRRRLERQTWFAACDPMNPFDPTTQRGLCRIAELVAAAKCHT